MTATLEPALELRWSCDVLVVQGQVPVAELVAQLGRSRARWIVIERFSDFMYAFTRQELRDWLTARGPDAALPVERALELHEHQRSINTRDRAAIEPIAGPAPRATALRYVAVNANGAPIAVGYTQPKAARKTRGARRKPAGEGTIAKRPLRPHPRPGIRYEPLQDLLSQFDAERSDEPEVSEFHPRPKRTHAAPPATVDDEGTRPLRYPSIETETPLGAGARVLLLVDLVSAPSVTTAGPALEFASQPADWSSLAIEVVLLSAGIQFEDAGRGQVLLRRNQSSVPARIAGIVSDAVRPGDTIAVQATFYHGTRCSGTALRGLVVADPSAASAQPSAATEGLLQVDTKAEPPDLTVFIQLLDSSAPGRMHWRMTTAQFDGLPAQLDGTIDLGDDPRSYALAMFEAFANMPRGQHRDRIEGFGERLWECAPAAFRNVYWVLNDHYQRPLTIQFSSYDPHLPWELMRPYRDGETHPPLALRHAVARWLGGYQGWLNNRLTAGKLLTIAPKYTTFSRSLSKAQAVASWLAEHLAAEPVEGTRDAVRKLLVQPPTEPVAVLYFTGHGAFNAKSVNASVIKLEDGSLAVDEVARREIMLGERHGTVVILNACEVGATAAALGDVAGWAQAFVSRRFRAFIAPLWAIDEEDAAQVTRELLTAIVKERVPIASALRDIRAKYGGESPTYYSYLFYGDVTSRLNAS